MDRGTAHEAARLIATLIGEIMEDHVDLALLEEQQTGGAWPKRLQTAGADIADLAKALEVIGRRSQ